MNNTKDDCLKRKFMNIIGTEYYVKRTFLVPIELVYKIEAMFYFLADNSLNIMWFGDFMVSFFLAIFEELITKRQIKNLWELVRIFKLIRNSLKEYCDLATESDYLFTFKQVKKIITEMKNRNFDADKQIDFYDFYYNHSKLIFGEKVLLDYNDIEKLFKLYEEHSSKR